MRNSLPKLVLVTGCFDLLHFAHKDFLKAARKQGDKLIVGLETDKRISKLKGKNRPVNNWSKRAKALKDLGIVDNIFSLPEKISFKEEQLNLLQKIKPDVLAVSKNSPFLEEKKALAKKLNIKVFVFPFNPHYSSSSLIAKKT